MSNIKEMVEILYGIAESLGKIAKAQEKQTSVLSSVLSSQGHSMRDEELFFTNKDGHILFTSKDIPDELKNTTTYQDVIFSSCVTVQKNLKEFIKDLRKGDKIGNR